MLIPAMQYLTDVEVAERVGMNPASVRRWRAKNKAAGFIKYGPPYEYHGREVKYPAEGVDAWIAGSSTEGGVVRRNLAPRAHHSPATPRSTSTQPDLHTRGQTRAVAPPDAPQAMSDAVAPTADPSGVARDPRVADMFSEINDALR